MKDLNPEFSYIIDTARLPAKGENVEISANDAQKKALAKRLGLEKIDSFQVDALVRPLNKHQVRATGTVKGKISQTCVVSLQPFDAEVEDSFNVLFEEPNPADLTLNEIDLDMSDEEEDVDVLENNKIDLGEIAVEYFSLALDPFPHAPNARFSDKIEDEPRKNAFSALEKLKKS